MLFVALCVWLCCVWCGLWISELLCFVSSSSIISIISLWHQIPSEEHLTGPFEIQASIMAFATI